MSDFDADDQILAALSVMDTPLTRGPLARWQRKKLENSVSIINNSLNASIHLNGVVCHNHTIIASHHHSSNAFNVSSNCLNKTPSNTSTNKSLSKCFTPNILSAKTRSSNSTHHKQCKTPKTPNASLNNDGLDRFIPNRRSAMNLEISHYLILNADKSDKENDLNLTQTENKNSHQLTTLAMSENSVDLINYRIMCYKDKASEEQANGLKVLYSSSKPSHSSAKKSTRYIPTKPERILDAPDVINDCNLQLIDWSVDNILAVALTREIYLWNANSGHTTKLLTLDEDLYVSSLSWIEEGNHLALGTSDGSVELWDTEKVRRVHTMSGHSGRVGCLSWNSHVLSSGSKSGAVHHYDVRVANHIVGTISAHSQEVCALKWSPGGHYLASGANDSTVNVWSNSISNTDNKPLYTFTEHRAPVMAIAWCPWKWHCLVGDTDDHTIKIWNCRTGINSDSMDTKSQVNQNGRQAYYRSIASRAGCKMYGLCNTDNDCCPQQICLPSHHRYACAGKRDPFY